MLKYRWICHLCEEVNGSTSSICEKCGFPAVASRNDLDLARENPTLKTTQHVNTSKQTPLPKKLAGGFALTALIFGVALAKLAPPVWLNITGLILIGLAFLALWALGFAGKRKDA